MLKKTVFMVMPFGDKDAQEVYEHCTRKVCEKFNLEIRRADELFTTNVILEDILEEIKNASVIIVDISGKNANVFYELGMSHILRPQQTIMITNEPHHETPFDIQHFRIIHYDNTVRGGKVFEEKLTKTLENLLQDYSLIYKDEFELLAKILGLSSAPLIGISMHKTPPRKDDFIDVRCQGPNGHAVENHSSAGNSVEGFINIGYARIENGMVFLTEKGKAFVSFLKEKGMTCELIEPMIWKQHPSRD